MVFETQQRHYGFYTAGKVNEVVLSLIHSMEQLHKKLLQLSNINSTKEVQLAMNIMEYHTNEIKTMIFPQNNMGKRPISLSQNQENQSDNLEDYQDTPSVKKPGL